MKNRVKILILLNEISRSSGGMSSALDLTETLYDLGFDVHVGLRSGHLLYCLKRLYSYRTKIPLKKIYTLPKHFGGFSFKFYSLFKIINRNNFISQLKNFIQSILVSVGQNEKSFKNTISKADIIIFAILLHEDKISEFRNNTKAALLYNHAGSPDIFEEFWVPMYKPINMEGSKRHQYIQYCKLYDGLIFQAHDQARECYSRDSSLVSLCHVVPPSCQEKEVLSIKQTLAPFPAGRRHIVNVGSLQLRKAQHYAIDVFLLLYKEYPDLDLHFVGGGIKSEYGIKLHDKVKELKLEHRIFFHGHRSDYLRFMAHSNIIIQTSEAEGVSRILREAILLGVPVVSFAISGTVSTLNNGTEALLVPPYDTNALAEAVNKLLSDHNYATALVEEAFKKYLINHSWVAYASNLKKMLEYFLKVTI